jgi:hypothetical protein
MCIRAECRGWDGGGEIETLAEGLVAEGFDLAHTGGALFKQLVF